MLRVYNYMGLGLVVTGLVAFVVASTPALYVPIFSSPLKWVVMLAPLAFVLLLLVPHTVDVGGRRTSHVLGLLRRHGPVAGLGVPGLHRNHRSPAPSSSPPRCSVRPASTATRRSAT